MIIRVLEKFISASIRTSLAAKYGFLDRTHILKNNRSQISVTSGASNMQKNSFRKAKPPIFRPGKLDFYPGFHLSIIFLGLSKKLKAFPTRHFYH